MGLQRLSFTKSTKWYFSKWRLHKLVDKADPSPKAISISFNTHLKKGEYVLCVTGTIPFMAQRYNNWSFFIENYIIGHSNDKVCVVRWRGRRDCVAVINILYAVFWCTKKKKKNFPCQFMRHSWSSWLSLLDNLGT